MSLDKLGLIFLLNYFNQLGEVKNHVLSAVREILLAVQATVDLVGRTSSNKALGGSADFLSPIIRKVQDVIQFTVEKVSPASEAPGKLTLEDGLRLKTNIVDSIISAINEEIENTRDTHDEKSKLKIEALDTVKKVLTNQKRKAFTPAPVETKRTSRPAHVA